MNSHEVAFTYAQAFRTLWGGRWVPPYVLYGELGPLLRDSSPRPYFSSFVVELLMGNPGVAQRELARRAAPVCYALRKARLPRLPLRCGGSAERDAALPEQDVGNVLVRTARRIRPRDARRVDAHRVRLAARGLRCKAPPFVPKDYIFVGPGDGWVPANRCRKGRKALRAAHRGRDARPHALPPVARRKVSRTSAAGTSLSSWAIKDRMVVENALDLKEKVPSAATPGHRGSRP